MKHKDEFTTKFRAYEILNLVRDRDEEGIAPRRIAHYFQPKYGIRWNKRKSFRNILENIVFSGLLEVSRGVEERTTRYQNCDRLEHTVCKPSIIKFRR